MRCFIAIDIPPDIKRQIDELVSKLGDGSKSVRWVSAQNIHLTLKFLGEVDEALLPDIQHALDDISKAHKSFPLTLQGVGGFPGFTHPRVIWVGITPSEALENIYQNIDKKLSKFGFEREEKRFSPHLTIGRVKDPKHIDSVMKKASIFRSALFGTINVTGFFLMKSVLKPTGAEYSQIAGFPLIQDE